MNEYLSLASFILPVGMLDWFNLKEVRTTTTYGQTTIHIYLNEKTTYESPSIPKMFQCRKKNGASFLPINMVQIVMFLGQIYEKIVR